MCWRDERRQEQRLESKFGKAFNFRLLETKREEGEERRDGVEGKIEGGEQRKRVGERQKGREGGGKAGEALRAEKEGGETEGGGWGQRARIGQVKWRQRETEGKGQR